MEKGKTGNARMVNTFGLLNDKDLFNELLCMVDESVKIEKPSKMNIYFAGPWFTANGATLYDAAMSIEKNVRKYSAYNVFYPRGQINKTPKDAFDNNVKHIKECDIVVALVAEKDVGTAWEIGMAHALGKDIYLLGYDESTFLSHTNVMLAFTGKCFTIKNWAKFLTRGLFEKDYVYIPNEWEGIE